MGRNAMPGPGDTYVAYGEGWANVSNTPFRLYKHWVHEGGISTPLVAHWPNGIARKGELDSQPGHLIDVMATAVDLSGAEYPKQRGDRRITPLEGRSLAPAFRGETIERDAIYWEHEGNRAVRVGDWKLVAKGEEGPWELYNIAADRVEMNDLSAKHPEKVKELAAKWQAYAERANVLPLGTWRAPARTAARLSTKRRFELDANASLRREQAPNVAGRGFGVLVELDKPGRNGVLVAQGGSQHGWVLFQKDGKLAFSVRRGSNLSTASCEQPAPSDLKTVHARLSKEGRLVLTVNGEPSCDGDLGGVVSEMPVGRFNVGRDEDTRVGEYKGAFPYDGAIGRVVVELAD
jgi:arylsulfatase